jgi:hypothetical protein
MEDPHVIVPVDCNPRRHAHDPIVRQRRRPRRPHLQMRPPAYVCHYLRSCRRRWPYSSSSANSTHLKSST